MTDLFKEVLKGARPPQVDGGTGLDGRLVEDSGEIEELLRGTEPERIAQAGRNYLAIATSCEKSVAELSTVARNVAETIGGESLKGVLEKLGELQQDLARIHDAALSVGEPLRWYGDDVLPWFKANVPTTGDLAIDDDIADGIGNTDTNNHAMARHHLRLLNAYMGEVYKVIPETLEQHSTAPQVGVANSFPGAGMPGLPGGMTGDPYAGTGLGSPYGTPGLSAPNLPGLKTPGLTDPAVPDGQNPALQNPSLQNPALQNPALQNPALNTPDPKASQLPQIPTTTDLSSNPALNTPDLKTSQLPQIPTTTDLSSNPQNPAPGQPNGTTSPTNGGVGPFTLPGTAQAAQFTGTSGTQAAAGRAAGMGPMGMMPPMMGGGGMGQERDRERTHYPMLEDETFETDDMGGPSVVA